MKKLLLSALALGFLALNQANAQCTPGNIFGEFEPLIGTNLPVASLNQPYSTTILFKAPATLTVSASSLPLPSQIAPFVGLLPANLTLSVSAMQVTGISGQPAGLIGSVGGGTGGSFIPGEQGCIGITGSATEGGNFVVTVEATYSLSITPSDFGLPVPGSFDIPQPVPNPSARTYNMSVPTSIEELDVTTFDLTNNAPNPFDSKTQILYSNPKPATVELNVYNMVGTLVYHNTYEAKKGKNAIEFYADKLSGGMYIYSLSNGSQVRTGKMTVTK